MGSGQHVGRAEMLPKIYFTMVLYFLAASVGAGERRLYIDMLSSKLECLHSQMML